MAAANSGRPHGSRYARQFILGKNAFHRQQRSAARAQVFGQFDKRLQIRKAPGYHHIEAALGLERLDSPRFHHDVCQTRFGDCLPQKCGFLVVAVEQYDLSIRAADGDRETRKAAA